MTTRFKFLIYTAILSITPLENRKVSCDRAARSSLMYTATPPLCLPLLLPRSFRSVEKAVYPAICFSASVWLVDNQVSERQMNSCDVSWRYSRMAGTLERLVCGIRPLTLKIENVLNKLELPEWGIPSDLGMLLADVGTAFVELGKSFASGAGDTGTVNIVVWAESLVAPLVGSTDVGEAEEVEGVVVAEEPEFAVGYECSSFGSAVQAVKSLFSWLASCLKNCSALVGFAESGDLSF